MKDTRQEVNAIDKAVREFMNAWNKKAYGKLTNVEYHKIVMIVTQLKNVLQQENK